MITLVEMRTSTDEHQRQTELRAFYGGAPQAKTLSKTIVSMRVQFLAWRDDIVEPAHANDLQLLSDSTWLHSRQTAVHVCPMFIS